MPDLPYDPFRLRGPAIPERDFDGPPMSTDEVERAMLADMAERMAEGDVDIDPEAGHDSAERDGRPVERPLANTSMLIGLAIAALGIAGTGWSWAAAAPGGSYSVFYGAILTGAVVFLRGMFQSE